MNVKTLVKKFGGQSILATQLGIGQSAIAYWVKKDLIPSKWHAQLLSIAQASSIDILATDLLAVKTGQDAVLGDEAETKGDSDTSSQQRNESALPLTPAIASGAEQFMFYAGENGVTKVQVLLGDETVWASQDAIAEIFDTTKQNISSHLSNIFNELELNEQATVKKILTVQIEGGRQVSRELMHYNMDAIISVGYRVNSYKATQFRRWATAILKEYLVKGFALDDERLKQGSRLFGKDYFDELLERIRKIRTSERMFWQKVTDLYSQCSVDYDKDSPVTKLFFTQIQNKFHYAIHKHTAAELIKMRADATKPNMGLTHFANMSKDGVLLKSDVTTGKNYLTVEELDELERLVENYLGAAELFAKRKIVMTMKDWVAKLDEYFRFNSYEVLEGAGRVTHDTAKHHAFAEYEKFRIEHDKKFKSDFDKLVEEAKGKKRLPKP